MKRCTYPDCLEEGAKVFIGEELTEMVLCKPHIDLAMKVWLSNNVAAIHRFKCKLKNERLKRSKNLLKV